MLVGVGVAPATEWLEDSGLELDGGIPTDAAGRTALPDVYAAGDVTRAFDPRIGARARTEHWEAAGRQGAAAARAMLGDEPAAPPPPSFWSDQYGIRFQYVGYAALADGRTDRRRPRRPRLQRRLYAPRSTGRGARRRAPARAGRAAPANRARASSPQ